MSLIGLKTRGFACLNGRRRRRLAAELDLLDQPTFPSGHDRPRCPAGCWPIGQLAEFGADFTFMFEISCRQEMAVELLYFAEKTVESRFEQVVVAKGAAIGATISLS